MKQGIDKGVKQRDHEIRDRLIASGMSSYEIDKLLI